MIAAYATMITNQSKLEESTRLNHVDVSKIAFNASLIIVIISTIDSNIKYKIFNKVTIYDISDITSKIQTIVDDYQNVFENKNTTIDISEKK